MQPNLNQELARIRYADALRAASRRHIPVRDDADAAPPTSRRRRLLRRLRPALG
jgi:hypothetical protein